MIVVKHVDSIFGSLLPIRLSTFKLVVLGFPTFESLRLNIKMVQCHCNIHILVFMCYTYSKTPLFRIPVLFEFIVRFLMVLNS